MASSLSKGKRLYLKNLYGCIDPALLPYVGMYQRESTRLEALGLVSPVPFNIRMHGLKSPPLQILANP